MAWKLNSFKDNKKTAIILIPGFRSKHLFNAVWNQLQKNKDEDSKPSPSTNKYNVIIDDDDLKEQQSFRIYEIDWSKETYNDLDSDHQFYGLFLSFQVFWDILCGFVRVVWNLLFYFVMEILLLSSVIQPIKRFLNKLSYPKSLENYDASTKRYWQILLSCLSAPLIPIGFFIVSFVSLSSLLVNLGIVLGIILNVLIEIEHKVGQRFFAKYLTKIAESLTKFLDYLLKELAECLLDILNCFVNKLPISSLRMIFDSSNMNTVTRTQEILIIFFIILWIIGIVFNSSFQRILELSNFTSNYCQNKFLRRRIRLKLLKTINHIMLDSSYKNVVIITHSFGTLLGAELLANYSFSKKISFISLGNVLGVVGIRYFNLIDNIIKKIQEYEWTDYYACFDLVATKMPKSNRTNLIQKTLKCKLIYLLDFLGLISGKYHLVYFLEEAYVRKNVNTTPMQEILAEYNL